MEQRKEKVSNPKSSKSKDQKGANKMNYKAVKTLPLSSLGSVIGIDLEGTKEGLNRFTDRPFCVTLSTAPGTGLLLWQKDLHQLQPLFDSDRLFVFFSAKQDVMTLQNAGLRLPWSKVHDAMLEDMALDSGSPASLAAKAARDLGTNKDKWTPSLYEDEARFICYACKDADLTLQLHNLYFPKLKSSGKLPPYSLERKLVPVLVALERRGVPVSRSRLEKIYELQGRVMAQLEKEIWDSVGVPFNLNAPKQIAEVLFGRLGIDARVKTRKGQLSTNKEVLRSIQNQHPVIPKIMLYRRMATHRRTHVKGLLDHVQPDGRVRAEFLQAGIPTKRIAAVSPSLLNEPKRYETSLEEKLAVRSAIVAPRGFYLLSADFSQIEFRLMIYSSKDPTLIKALEDGVDFHRVTARMIIETISGVRKKLSQITEDERAKGKTFNYGLSYGMSEKGVASRLGLSMAKARAVLDRFSKVYEGLYRWMVREKQRGLKTGCSRTWLQDPLRKIDGLSSPFRGEREKAARNIINDQIQGGAAEIFKLSLIRYHRNPIPGVDLLLPIHDEALFQVPDELPPERVAAQLKPILTVDLTHRGLGFYPVDFKHGKSFHGMKKIQPCD